MTHAAELEKLLNAEVGRARPFDHVPLLLADRLGFLDDVGNSVRRNLQNAVLVCVQEITRLNGQPGDTDLGPDVHQAHVRPCDAQSGRVHRVPQPAEFVDIPDPAVRDYALDSQGGQQAAINLAEESAGARGIVAVLQHHHDRAAGIRSPSWRGCPCRRDP